MHRSSSSWHRLAIPLVLLLITLVFTFGLRSGEASAEPAEKSALEVLYVGPNPDQDPKVPDYVTGEAARRMVELTRERMPAFKTLLEEHFSTLRLVNAEDYDATMSEGFDVTIFDAQPKTIETRDVGGWPKKLRLPDDFTHAALTVGEVGPFMLGRFGFDLKLDHL